LNRNHLKDEYIEIKPKYITMLRHYSIRPSAPLTRDDALRPITGRADIVSPYLKPDGGAYTPDQLAMQRKIAILKYNKNTKDTHAQRLYNASMKKTKKPIHQQIADGDICCREDETIPTLNTGMNVPGPAMTFVYDPTVPLYLFSANR
jgi:hypothetical protein